jgi:hypothetical protein
LSSRKDPGREGSTDFTDWAAEKQAAAKVEMDAAVTAAADKTQALAGDVIRSLQY